jgi:hypothetical protein
MSVTSAAEATVVSCGRGAVLNRVYRYRSGGEPVSGRVEAELTARRPSEVQEPAIRPREHRRASDPEQARDFGGLQQVRRLIRPLGCIGHCIRLACF